MKKIRPLELLFSCCRGSLVLKLFLAALNGAVLPLTVILVQRLIDSVNANASASFFYVALLGGTFFLEAVCMNADNIISLRIKNAVNFRLEDEILQKCSRIPYQLFETSDTNKDVRKILEKHDSAVSGFISFITSCVRITVMFAGLFYYLIMIQWWILLLIVLSVTPVLFLSVVITKREYDDFGRYFPFLLKAFYLSELITQRRNIKECRVFQYLNYVESMWEKYLQQFHNAQVKSNLKPRFLTGFCVILQYAVTILNLFILYPEITANTLSIGMFVAIAQAVWTFVGGFQYELIGMIHNWKNYGLFRDDYTLFIKTPEISYETEPEVPQRRSFSKISLENIWFRYNENGPYILRGINLEIHCGDKIGIVGENGSGKSTLIKIILGLLKPNEGQITIDDEPVVDNNRYRLWRMMSAVFQDYSRFNLTLGESLSLYNPGDVKNVEKARRILNNLRREDDFFAHFNKGLDTPLGKNKWEGYDLSGGEWQIITLARSLFSDRPILILDEPTSSLDPLAEVDVYNQIYHSNDINTLIMVTHRLGGITQTDRIFLLAGGIIPESGSHAELMWKEGRYMNMFNTQREWYLAKTNRRLSIM
jgi:ATP-binding cassette subfamily B protein